MSLGDSNKTVKKMLKRQISGGFKYRISETGI